MTQILITVLVLLYIQALATGFCVGLWIASRNKKESRSVADFFPPTKNVDILGKTTAPILKDVIAPKATPRSAVMKFPDPEKVRKQKDQDQVNAYMEDMQKNERPSGPFVL